MSMDQVRVDLVTVLISILVEVVVWVGLAAAPTVLRAEPRLSMLLHSCQIYS